jgi:hypothetical protein
LPEIISLLLSIKKIKDKKIHIQTIVLLGSSDEYYLLDKQTKRKSTQK